MNEIEKERQRMAIEDAVNRALEAGWTKPEVRDEFEYALDSFEADDADE